MASSSGKCTIDILSAGNCNCYLITLQISYLNLSLYIYIFLSLSTFLCFSFHPAAYAPLSLSSIRGRSCLFGRRDSYLHKGGEKEREKERERDVSRSARCSIDTKSIINESTGRNDIADARVLDPSGPVCSCWTPETGWLRSADDFPLQPPSPLHTNEFHGCWDSPVRWDELVSVHELAVSVEWRGGKRGWDL